MYLVFGRKIKAVFLGVVLLGLATLQAAAQGDKGYAERYYDRLSDTKNNRDVKVRGKNLPDYDEQRVHYGFFLGLNFSRYRARRNDFFNQQLENPDTNSILGVNPVGSPGFTLGFILDMRLDKRYFEFRVLPTVAFYQRKIDFRHQNGDIVQQLHQSTYSYAELPLMLKFKSKRRNNFRMYMNAGVKPGLEVGSKRDELDESFLRVQPSNFSLEFGFGADMYYPYFKFAPEIRFSIGLLDQRTPADENLYADSLKRISTHTVTLFFNFE